MATKKSQKKKQSKKKVAPSKNLKAKLESSRTFGKKQLQQYLLSLEKKMNQITQNLGTIFNNQQELAESAERLDEQFAVLTRLSIREFNTREDREKITYEFVNTMFMDWKKFKTLQNFRDFSKGWFIGEDLNKLVEEATAALELEAKKSEQSQGEAHVEGSVGNETVEQAGRGCTGEDETTPVPTLPRPDPAIS
jgi:hypothetical protein